MLAQFSIFSASTTFSFTLGVLGQLIVQIYLRFDGVLHFPLFNHVKLLELQIRKAWWANYFRVLCPILACSQTSTFISLRLNFLIYNIEKISVPRRIIQRIAYNGGHTIICTVFSYGPSFNTDTYCCHSCHPCSPSSDTEVSETAAAQTFHLLRVHVREQADIRSRGLSLSTRYVHFQNFQLRVWLS